MRVQALTLWTALSAVAVLITAALGWSWELSADLARAQARVEAMERGMPDEPAILQRLARLEEALSALQRGQERTHTSLDHLMRGD